MQPAPRRHGVRCQGAAGRCAALGIIDFNPFAGLELASCDGRLPVLRELAVELLPEVRIGDECLRSLLPDKFHRVAEAELVDDHRPFELRHPQRIRARRRFVRQALAIADLAHLIVI